ncbi:MAG: class I SAM-dependent methyltransferase [Ignavibacteriales bacterium]|nr:class I SAM-dependent methyltransferase [Ignavibacteriales bacterium]
MVEGYGKQDGVEYLDIMNMNLKYNSFDYVLCNHVLEHAPDDKIAMKEIYRVLKKDGTAIITIPINEKFETTYEDSNITSPQEREKHFGQWDHVRWYGVDVKRTLENIGFKVEMIRYAEKFSAEENRKFGLFNDFIISSIKN